MLIKIQKEGRERLVTQEQLAVFREKGYSVVPEEKNEGPIVQQDNRGVGRMVLVPMINDEGRERMVEPNQVVAMKEKGYALKTEGGSDGERDEGRIPVEGSEDLSGGEGSGEAGGSEGEGSGSGEDTEVDDEPSEVGSGVTDETSEEPAAEEATGDEEIPVLEQIAAALRSLDHKDDSLWTVHGNPRVAVVEKIVGFDVTQDQVRDAIPGFKREEA